MESVSTCLARLTGRMASPDSSLSMSIDVVEAPELVEGGTKKKALATPLPVTLRTLRDGDSRLSSFCSVNVVPSGPSSPLSILRLSRANSLRHRGQRDVESASESFKSTCVMPLFASRELRLRLPHFHSSIEVHEE